jgi:transposase
MDITLIGIDVAKNVFQLAYANKQGKIVKRKRISREKLLQEIAQQPACTIAMEACGSANYWAREFKALNHEVKLIASQHVKPYVRGNKNDYRDSEAIVEAASRPQMRFVTAKTIEQQDIQSILRVREGYISMRTRIINQIRGLLSEYGIIIPQGAHRFRQVLADIYDRHTPNALSLPMKALLETQYKMIESIDENIDSCENTLKSLIKKDERCQRLMAIEGIGLISAAALVTSAGNGYGFKNGRHFAAFIGLVPKQYSSGNTQKLLGISKRGDEFTRRMLIHGARSVVMRSHNKKDARSRWIQRLINERGMNRATVALANKNARIAMALLLSGEVYRKAA